MSREWLMLPESLSNALGNDGRGFMKLDQWDWALGRSESSRPAGREKSIWKVVHRLVGLGV